MSSAKQKENDTIAVSTRITKPMYEQVMGIIQTDAHLNISDYLRDLVRKDIENRIETGQHEV